jgi:alpha-glucosidase
MKHFLILLLLLLISCHPTSSQWQSIGNMDSYKKTDNGVLISAPPAKLSISVIAPDVIRVRLTTNGTFAPDSSWAVITHKIGDQNFSLNDTDKELILTTASGSLHIQKKPIRLSFYDGSGKLVSSDDAAKGIAWSGTESAVWKTMPQNESYFGLGEKASSHMNRRGRMFTNWNSDIPSYKFDTDPLYQTIPFFYGLHDSTCYGIFFDNTYYSHFDFGKSDPAAYSFGATGGEMNYYFFFGPQPVSIMKNFAALIGTMPFPPKWAIGYQQCRWSYYPESRVREIASTFRSKKIPCDVIYLDIHYMNGYRCFTWDSTRFPDPKKMTDDLAKDGFKIVTIVDPGIKQDTSYWVYQEGAKGDHFVKKPDGSYFIGKVWPGECAFPDFTDSSARVWWGSLYKVPVSSGVMGFWNDMNEPSVFDVPTKTIDLDALHNDNGLHSTHAKDHNVYGMQMVRGTYEGVKLLRPNERPFVLTRANYAGGNRYAAAWTGDNVASWDHLRMGLQMCMGLSISGQPFVGTDIGGFIGMPSGELFSRWLESAVFTPLMRAHSAIDAPNKEPWVYGDTFETVNRKAIEMRYTFLPYIYTAFYQSSLTGVPMMRPLFFDYPGDQDAVSNGDEYLFGDAILVAPVVWEGATERGVHIPPGIWYDYYTDSMYTGPDFIHVSAPLDRLPIFVKAGSAIPTQQVVQYTDQAPIDTLTLNVYPTSTQVGSWEYEDDGRSYGYQNNEYMRRWISVRGVSYGEHVTLGNPQGKYTPPARTIVLKFNGFPHKPAWIETDAKDQKFTYDEKLHSATVIMQDDFKKHVFVVRKW